MEQKLTRAGIDAENGLTPEAKERRYNVFYGMEGCITITRPKKRRMEE
ncbi:MAG: hypothetical protein LBF89_04670 [Bacteroidales bacterium]|jgi:hypothetical protein|nr:hypothetical protein [Bacteroidales bacterium]